MLPSGGLLSIYFILLNLLFLNFGLCFNFLDSTLRASSLVFSVIIILLIDLGSSAGGSVDFIVLSLTHNLSGCLVNDFHLLLGNLSSPVVLDLVDAILINKLLLLITEALFLSLWKWVSILEA